MRQHYEHLLNRAIDITEVIEDSHDNSVIDFMKYMIDYYDIHFPLDVNRDINELAKQARPYLNNDKFTTLTVLKHNLDKIHPDVFLIAVYRYLIRRHELRFIVNPRIHKWYDTFHLRCGDIVYASLKT